MLIIHEDDDLFIGFSSSTYRATESEQQVTVCVQVLNSESGGALRPFNVSILPEEGKEISSIQYTLECNRVLHFEVGQSEVCHNYSITNDETCELGVNATQFKLRLSLSSTDRLRIKSSLSETMVTIDDSREPECYVAVQFQSASYTVSSQSSNSVEICVKSTSKGTSEEFVIIPGTNTRNSTYLSHSPSRLNFVVESENLIAIQCYNISVHFQAQGICDLFGPSCDSVHLSTRLSKGNKNDPVSITGDSAEVVVEVPDQCKGPTPTQLYTETSRQIVTPSDNKLKVTSLHIRQKVTQSDRGSIVITASVASVVVAIAVAALMVMIIFYYKKKRSLVTRYIIEESNGSTGVEHVYMNLDTTKRSLFSEQLKKQLESKKLIYTKDQLQLSTTVGQGESGLVYKGYLDTALGKELVAVKIGKALFTQTDMETLTKEVSTMLSFEHEHVMALIGVCMDAEMPLLIMPFMSNGSVLEFVRHHKDELFCSISSVEMVEGSRQSLLKLCHQISKGMEYLAQQKFVHRDLAARNCMIDRDGVIKVADFGLTEDMYGTNYFRRRQSVTGSEERLPMKWMAPESIENDIFTEATDVWAFGVTMWEIFTCGRTPYSGVPAMSLLKTLKRGERLERPDNKALNEEINEIMMQCWSLDPTDRPRFHGLVPKLSHVLETESGYLELFSSLSFCWKNDPEGPPSSPLPLTGDEGKGDVDEGKEDVQKTDM